MEGTMCIIDNDVKDVKGDYARAYDEYTKAVVAAGKNRHAIKAAQEEYAKVIRTYRHRGIGQ